MREKYSNLTMRMAKKAAKEDKLGFFEKMKLKRIAKKDAKHSIPSPNGENVLSAAFIQRERESMGESLKELELFTITTFKDSYITCDTLLNSLATTKATLEKLENKTPPDLTETEQKIKKPGEKKVHETTVAKRRRKEHATKNATFYSTLSSAKGRLSNDIERLRNESSLLNSIENECISVAEKILCHHLARVEYYWRKVQPIRAKADSSFPTAVPIPTMQILRSEYEDYIRTLEKKRDHRIAKVESVLKEVA